ncbi:MAG: PAS domain S-box protein [Bacteroidia bacterium]
MNSFLADASHLENSTEFLWGLTDTEFRFLHTNRLFQKQFGLENENWKGRLFQEVVQTFQIEKFLQANDECINNPGKTISIEIQTTTATNENWFRWEVSAIVNKENNVEGIRFLGTDITKQKKAEQTLLQQAILLDNISDSIISADQNFCIKSWNLKAEMMFNLKHEKESNNVLHEIRKVNFINDSENNFKNLIDDNGFWNGDVLIEKNNGTKFYLQTMVNAIKDKAGSITGFVAVSRDITKEHEIKNKFDFEQKRSRHSLVTEQKQFKSFMENAPLLAWITDAEGVLLYMNTRFKSSFNYTDDHLYKKIGSITSLTEREQALLPHTHKNAFIKNKSIEFLHEWIDENKNVHYYRTFKFPIQDVEGNYLEGGQSIEITAELMAERALKRSNELFEYASKATRDVIWDWNLKEDKIRRTNGYTSLFGYEMTNLYEPNSYERIHKDDIAGFLKIVENALNKNDSRWQLEYRYLCADGSYKTVIDQAYIIRNKNGKAVRVIGSMQDVTEERDLQKQVLITEKQKKKDVVNAVIDAQEKERNELSAELHDNVNQLLAASILYLKTAQKQEVIKENLITQSLDYVQKAVDELRNISRNLTPSELKMNGLSAALKVFAEKLYIPKSFEVKLVIGELNEAKINQPLKLAVYRIVQEVINNIIKHANATNVAIHLSETDNNLKLTVTDNGKGVDLLAIKKGLGIINIYNRAENFGGSAEIISSPGKGCTWNVLIPLS